jgi:MFS transporter, OPA family, solute carrier family 37 (glycerol-3-phosphate transporter), member 1/2
MIDYSFLYWLTFYLSNKYEMAEAIAGTMSIFYDIGGISGGIICGLISDIIGKRSIVIFSMLSLAIPSLLIFSRKNCFI